MEIPCLNPVDLDWVEHQGSDVVGNNTNSHYTLQRFHCSTATNFSEVFCSLTVLLESLGSSVGPIECLWSNRPGIRQALHWDVSYRLERLVGVSLGRFLLSSS